MKVLKTVLTVECVLIVISGIALIALWKLRVWLRDVYGPRILEQLRGREGCGGKCEKCQKEESDK